MPAKPFAHAKGERNSALLDFTGSTNDLNLLLVPELAFARVGGGDVALCGVRFVVEGSVRRAASRLGISARLIDASTDDHLWTEKYDGTVEDVFTMQENLARTIVDALQLQLTADEHQRLGARPISNVHAYECYLQARQAAFRWRQDAIDHAVQLLHNGLAIVGDNAELYAALGRAYLQYREAGIDLSERPLRQAENCAGKVFALDPLSASGIQLRGWIHIRTVGSRQPSAI